MLLPTNSFPTNITTLAALLGPFVITSISTSCRDKLESTPLKKPLKQHFFLSHYWALRGGLLIKLNWISVHLFQLSWLDMTYYLGTWPCDNWTLIYHPFTLQPCNIPLLSHPFLSLCDSNYWTYWYKQNSTNPNIPPIPCM